MLGEAAFIHTEVIPLLIVAVGNGLTVTVTLSDCNRIQFVGFPSWTLTREYVNIPAAVVGTENVTLLFPAAVVTV